jgi:hypothetical protein
MNVEDRKFEIGSKVRITRGVCIGREGVIEQIEHEVLFVDIYYIRCYKQLNHEGTLSEQWVWKTADAMELVENGKCSATTYEDEIRDLRVELHDKTRENYGLRSQIQQLRDKLKEQAETKSNEEAAAQQLKSALADFRWVIEMTKFTEEQEKKLKELRAKIKEQKKEIYRLKQSLNAAHSEIDGLLAMAGSEDKKYLRSVVHSLCREWMVFAGCKGGNQFYSPLERQKGTLSFLFAIFDWYNVKLWLNNDKLELVGDGEQKFTLTLTTAPGFGAEDAERVLKKLEKGQNV